MAFVGRPNRGPSQFDTPEEMYLRGALPRTSDAAHSLWVHQGDVLRAYAETYKDETDLALELPTGTGKTLPGLLIAEWVRRKSEGPVLYATPTRQLAHQVYETAKTEGVLASLLIGSHRNWSAADESDVNGGKTIAITTYSSIFNSSPKLPVPRLIVLDDAHAGEQFVGEQYGVTIRRSVDEESYVAILAALRPFFSSLQVQRLLGPPDPGSHHQVRLIIPAVDPNVLRDLDAALATLGESYAFSYSMIRGGLAACCVYVSYGGIQVRPMIPPTFENSVFSRAAQRVYLSATLGSGGELERAFGRPEIARLALSRKTPPRSGRRLFVFPELASGGDSVGLAREIVGITNKALVLSQASTEKTEEAARALAGEDVPVFGRAAVENGLTHFLNAPKGVLGLANRYDGMDLPDEACRIVVLRGSPDSVSLQERFLSERAQAGAALSERLRTRVVQGAGRCTRGPNDYAVVVALGSDLTRYFSRPENQSALEPELQAEVQFGLENSRGIEVGQVLDRVRIFLEHGDVWREVGEPLVAEFREDVETIPPRGAQALGESASVEVDAWQLAHSGEWIAASQQLEAAARILGLGGEATRGYRGLLLYIAAVWLSLGAEGEAHRARVRAMLRSAEGASGRGTWLWEMRQLNGAEETELTRADMVAIDDIAVQLTGFLKANRIRDSLERMCDQLGQTDAGPYEEALTTLGRFLGAEASRPRGEGRSDSAWLWNSAVWVTIEAKSEEHPDGTLPLADIRQANTQLGHLVVDQKATNAPAGSATIIISDRLSVRTDHSWVANRNVYLVSTDVISQLAGDVKSAWANLLAAADRQDPSVDLRQYVQNVLSENGCLPSQVLDRLKQYPIRP